MKTWVNPSLSCVSINVNAAAELIATVEAISIDFDKIPSLMMILWRSRWARLGYELVKRGLPTLFVVGVGVWSTAGLEFGSFGRGKMGRLLRSRSWRLRVRVRIGGGGGASHVDFSYGCFPIKTLNTEREREREREIKRNETKRWVLKREREREWDLRRRLRRWLRSSDRGNWREREREVRKWEAKTVSLVRERESGGKAWKCFYTVWYIFNFWA